MQISLGSLGFPGRLRLRRAESAQRRSLTHEVVEFIRSKSSIKNLIKINFTWNVELERMGKQRQDSLLKLKCHFVNKHRRH